MGKAPTESDAIGGLEEWSVVYVCIEGEREGFYKRRDAKRKIEFDGF